MPSSITIPGLQPIVRHAVPNVVECNLIPVAVFIVALHLWNGPAAIVTAGAWTALTVFRRKRRGSVPGLLVLASISLAVRSLLALATGSLFVYFVQPTAGTGLMALAFVLSVPLGRPLAERLALDICPFEPATRDHPALRAFLAKVSVLWGLAGLVNFTITLWLLLTQTTTTFVLVKAALGPGLTIAFSAVAIVWFRASMSRQNIRVLWARAADETRGLRAWADDRTATHHHHRGMDGALARH